MIFYDNKSKQFYRFGFFILLYNNNNEKINNAYLQSHV